MKFYSEVTKKLYNSEEELNAAEQEIVEAEAKKAEAAKAKKEEAKVVEEAFKARNAASIEYNTKVMAARKAYNETLVAAGKAFEEAVADATKVKNAAEEKYNAALKDFTDKHPEGYHMTLKDGDNIMTISSQGDSAAGVLKEYNSLIDYLMKNLWK
jgi:membrane protein involved in colicin uptake